MSEWQGWVDTARTPLDEPGASLAETSRASAWRLAHGLPIWPLGLVCLAAAWISILISRQTADVANIWFGNAPAIAWLMLSPVARWPGLLVSAGIGIVTANLLAGDALLRALSFLPANLLEIALAAWLLRRAGLHQSSLRRPIDLLRLLALGGLAAQVPGAIAGAVTVVAQGGTAPWLVGLSWFQGAVIGALSLLPLSVLVLRRPQAVWREDWRDPHLLWLTPLALGTTLLCLAQLPFPFIYLSLPLLTAAMVVAFSAVTLLTAAVSLTVALALATEVFVPPPVSAQWQQVYVYMAYAAALVPAQLLAAAVAELRDHQTRLAARSEQLRRANEGLEQFVRIASHDLREPLNTVVQFAGLLEADHAERLPPEARQYLGLVRRAAARMRALLDDVLRYTRVQSTDWPAPQRVSLDEVLVEVRQDLAGRLLETGARLRVEALPVVPGQAPLLGLLFLNLVSNAMKFVAPGVVPEIVVSARERDGLAEISVSDNGIGIAEAEQGKLFKPFSRLRLRREYDGTGLGLALCRQIAARHGGRIGVQSRPGEGATFTVTLPLH